MSSLFVASTIITTLTTILVPLLLCRYVLLASSVQYLAYWFIGAFCSIIRLILSIFHIVWIGFDVFVLCILKSMDKILKMYLRLSFSRKFLAALREVENVTDYENFECIGRKIDLINDCEKWSHSITDFPQALILARTTQKLQELRNAGNQAELMYALSGVLKRNHLGIDEPYLHSRHLFRTKSVIEEFLQEVDLCLIYLSQQGGSTPKKIEFFRTAARSVGISALCLSGGGSLAMYHLGVIKCLISAGIYKDLRVISGTSGGSIAAGLCAYLTDEELLAEAAVDWVSLDFRHNGVMKRDNIRWFPPLWKQLFTFITRGHLLFTEDFERTCKHYYGDVTFQEAYEKTRKHVCITVAANRYDIKIPQRLLLNHISTPHVLIRSAVAASCALPGIMQPVVLMCKNSEQVLVPFEMDGTSWIDGSVQADLPFRRLSTLFGVSSYIVSQVNPHVVPFLDRHALFSDLHGFSSSTPNSFVKGLDDVSQLVQLDIRQRVQALSAIGVVSKFKGQDWGNLVAQKYGGHITIVPSYNLMESCGIKAIQNPTEDDIRRSISGGIQSTLPHLHYLRHLVSMEKSILNGLEHLRQQAHLSITQIPRQMSINSFIRDQSSADTVNREEVKWRPSSFSFVDDLDEDVDCKSGIEDSASVYYGQMSKQELVESCLELDRNIQVLQTKLAMSQAGLKNGHAEDHVANHVIGQDE